jgi:hypothetical protein
MLSRLSRFTIVFAMSIVLCVALPPVQATPAADQPSIYLPMVQPKPVVSLSDPVTLGHKYGSFFIGDVVNASATQAFSVTLRAVIYDPCQAITDTLIIPTLLLAVLPRQSAPYEFDPPCQGSSEDVVRSLTFDQVIPISASAIRPLTVLPKTIQCNCVCYSYGYITGSVRNDNTVKVDDIRVAVWSLRNDHSHGFGIQYITEPLAPGAEQDFSTGYFPGLCIDGRPDPTVSINSFNYAAQGVVMP